MSSKLKFITKTNYDDDSDIAPGSLVIYTDNWDDFNHKVQFHLYFFDKNNVRNKIGTFKALQIIPNVEASIHVSLQTRLPESFSALGEEFISLGQEEDYYKLLHKFLGSRAINVLVALRDIAWQPALAIDFEPLPAFRNAMMRENSAHRSRRFGVSWIQGEKTQDAPAFSYSCTLAGDLFPVATDFCFDPGDPLPGRVVAIIGRNAAGKTRFLANLSEDLVQLSRMSAETIEQRDANFPKGRPLFTRVVAISYSAFDHFRRPDERPTSSYVYCGIRNSKGAISRTNLLNSYKRNIRRIHLRGMEAAWSRHIGSILGDVLLDALKEEAAAFENDGDGTALSMLSSGQAILCHFVTGLLAWIQPNSLVLFDEPETHLHPNAVANLFLVLSKILESFDSYAIIATHSPVVIQEVPGKRVILFSREDDQLTAETLSMESFGESITELTRHVFETVELESLYKKTLRNIAKNYKKEDALSLFENGLGIGAQAYLLAQYNKKK